MGKIINQNIYKVMKEQYPILKLPGEDRNVLLEKSWEAITPFYPGMRKKIEEKE